MSNTSFLNFPRFQAQSTLKPKPVQFGILYVPATLRHTEQYAALYDLVGKHEDIRVTITEKPKRVGSPATYTRQVITPDGLPLITTRRKLEDVYLFLTHFASRAVQGKPLNLHVPADFLKNPQIAAFQKFLDEKAPHLSISIVEEGHPTGTQSFYNGAWHLDYANGYTGIIQGKVKITTFELTEMLHELTKWVNKTGAENSNPGHQN